MSPLGPGRIIGAVDPGRRGGGKERPMIITTRRADIVRTGQTFAIICSTQFEEPIQHDEVLMPREPSGKCLTQPREPTVAVCNGSTTLTVDQIQRTSGLVSSAIVREICRKANFTYPTERR